MRILMSGSSGFIGSALLSKLQLLGHEVFPLTRIQKPGCVFWNPSQGILNKDDFEHFDAVIHLAGENLFSWRWTKKKKEKLR